MLSFSGGEPLIRPGIVELAAYASDCGLHPALSTNGTLVTLALARRLKDAELGLVNLHLNTVGPQADTLRDRPGSYNATLTGLRNLLEAGLRVGLQATLTRRNYSTLDSIFDFVEREKIDRVCIHHLVYTGRGNQPVEDLSHDQTRQAMDLILRRAEDFRRRGLNISVLTADNYVDGPYLYLKLAQKDPVRAADVYRHLEMSGGGTHSSGVGIAGVDAEGNVHPDPYWSHYSFGSLREKSFASIWTDESDPLMAGLKNRLQLLKGRCANCRFKQICGGSSRVRAEQIYGDPWMPDPACYLTEREITQELPHSTEIMENDVLLEKRAA